MKPFVAILLFCLLSIAKSDSNPLLAVNSVNPGDYYVIVKATLSAAGTIYAYPVPTSVEVPPSESSIQEYGFSASCQAGVQTEVVAQNLVPTTAYNIYVSGKASGSGLISSPGRILRVVTTTKAIPPHLTLYNITGGARKITIEYSLTASGTIWCYAYTPATQPYASVQHIVSSVIGTAVTAHVRSNYMISGLDSHSDYHTYCVAEDTKQVMMNNTFASTHLEASTIAEPPVLSYLGNIANSSTITVTAISNLKANVYGKPVVYDSGYVVPSVTQIKAFKVPLQVQSSIPFNLLFASLIDDTQYAVSLYSEDIKGFATQQSVSTTTYFIKTDIVRCAAEGVWPVTAHSTTAYVACELGYGGVMSRYCSKTTLWGNVQSTCERNYCPTSSVWPRTPSLTHLNATCGVGFVGTAYRTCNANGEWSTPDRNECVQLMCAAEGVWPETGSLTTARVSCGSSFHGDITRYCDAMGEWESASSASCVAKKICESSGGWPATYELDSVTRPCSGGFTGSVSRTCAMGPVWGPVVEQCSRITCPADGQWPETESGLTRSLTCPVGTSGNMRRECSSDGYWGVVDVSDCAQIFCPEENNWPKTLAGLVSLGPCPYTKPLGNSTRICYSTGVWGVVDTSSCYVSACVSEGVWPVTPTGTTVRRTCPAGKIGYHYRTCNALAQWENEVNDCVQLMCPATDQEMPSIPAGTSRSAPCGEHFSGEQIGVCSMAGEWVSVNRESCIELNTCVSDGVWPRTNVGTTRVIVCGSGMSGSRSRVCGSDGLWGLPNESNCVQLYCESSGEWPKTEAATSAVRPCLSDQIGVRLRQCNATGYWENPVSNCYSVFCRGSNGFGDTPGGQNATKSCDQGYHGNYKRLCDDEGRWMSVVNECELNTCPAMTNFPPTAHSTSGVIVNCVFGYSGTMSADCDVEGQWSVPDVTNCKLKTCLPNGKWPLTYALQTAVTSCPMGYTGNVTRYCGDGVWDSQVSNCEQITCKADGGWMTTGAGETRMMSCGELYWGNQYRSCSLSGVWGVADRSSCVEIKCEPFEDWPESTPGAAHVKICEVAGVSGLRIVECLSNGVWDNDGHTCYTTYCSASSGWPLTTAGSTRRGTCPPSYDGYSTRYCSAVGLWSDVNYSHCELMVCAGDTTWPPTPKNTITSIKCPPHANGNMTRECGSDAVWKDPVTSDCVNHSCPSDDVWPMTPIGLSLITTCGLGWRGYQSRKCGNGGVWEDADRNSCVQILCTATGDWPLTPAGETVTHSCTHSDYIGNITRSCSYDGAWYPIMNNCVLKTCPSTLWWPETPIKTLRTQSCPPGYVGQWSRECKETGEWESENLKQCTQLKCAGSGVWPSTPTYVTHSLPCVTGYLGEMRRTCRANLTWSDVDMNDCKRNFCIGDNVWPQTNAGLTSSRQCVSGYSGWMDRQCGDDAEWRNANVTACYLIPSPVGVVMTHVYDYFAIFSFTPNTNMNVFTHSLTQPSVAPSATQIVTSGVRTTCSITQSPSQLLCNSLVSGLSPSKRFDVYSWYVSEQGVHSDKLMSDWKKVIDTQALIRYDLNITSTHSDTDFIVLQVNTQLRAANVWCKALLIDSVPSISSLKAVQAVLVSEGVSEGYVIIPNVIEMTNYYVYCYSMDVYGNEMRNTIASTRHFTVTGSGSVSFTYSLISVTHNSSLIHSLSNRNGHVNCLPILHSSTLSPTIAQIQSSPYSATVTDNVTASVTVEGLSDITKYKVYCVLTYAFVVTSYSPSKYVVATTHAGPPSLTLSLTAVGYSSVFVSVLSTRDAYVWCLSRQNHVIDGSLSLVSVTPEEFYETPRYTVRMDEPYEIYLSNLMKGTNYTIYCYGESEFGLQMTNSPIHSLSLQITTGDEPPIISVIESVASMTSVDVSVQMSCAGTLRCIVIPRGTSSEVPAEYHFANANPVVSVSEASLVNLVIEGLNDGVMYDGYCLARDMAGAVMATPISNTLFTFTTLADTFEFIITNHTLSSLTLSLTIITDVPATVWCGAYYSNEPVPSATHLKDHGESAQIPAGNEEVLMIPNLNSNTHYSSYCHAEKYGGKASSLSISDSKYSFITPTYPSLTLTINPLANLYSFTSVTVDVLVTHSSTVYCRAREHVEDSIPVSNDWITASEGGVSEESDGVSETYLTIGSLLPNTTYDVHCQALTHSSPACLSLQPLTSRTALFTTHADTTGPVSTISFNEGVPYITSLPFNATVSFSEPVYSLDITKLSFENMKCEGVAERVSNKRFILSCVANSHGEMKMSVSEGAATDLFYNNNYPTTHVSEYVGGYMSVQVSELGPIFAKVLVNYTNSANISCASILPPPLTQSLTQSLSQSLSPSSCEQLRQLPSAVTRQLLGSGSLNLSLTDLKLNTEYDVYCCAIEPYNISMVTELLNTRNTINLGWQNCPKNNEKVCSDHGVCHDGWSCECGDGYFGYDCNGRCEGLYFTTSGGAVECSGHGVCDTATSKCQCTDPSTYQQPDCFIRSLSSTHRPPSGHSLIVSKMDMEVSENIPEYLVDSLALKENLLKQLSSHLSIDVSATGVSSWSIKPKNEVLTHSLTHSDTHSLIHSLSEDPYVITVTTFSQVSESSTSSAINTLKKSEVMSEMAGGLGDPRVRSLTSTHVFAIPADSTDPVECYDMVKNGQETDVDCGGNECDKRCATGQMCYVVTDCDGVKCGEDGVCESLLPTWAIIVLILFGIILVVGIVFLVFIAVKVCNMDSGAKQPPKSSSSTQPSAPADNREIELSSVGVGKDSTTPPPSSSSSSSTQPPPPSSSSSSTQPPPPSDLTGASK